MDFRDKNGNQIKKGFFVDTESPLKEVYFAFRNSDESVKIFPAPNQGFIWDSFPLSDNPNSAPLPHFLIPYERTDLLTRDWREKMENYTPSRRLLAYGIRTDCFYVARE